MEILSTSSVFTLTVIALITVILSKFFPANRRIERTITWLASESLLGPFLAILHPEKILGPVLAICLRITISSQRQSTLVNHPWWPMESPTFLFSFKLLATGLTAIVLAKFVSLLHHQYNYWRKRRVPHVGAVPVLGSSWRIFTRRMSLPNFCSLVYKHRPSSRYLGMMDCFTPVVVVRDPDLIKEIAVKNFDHFPDHHSFINEKIDPIFGKNVFSLKGDRWREMRNTLSPSFTASKMRFMFELVSSCSEEFVRYLYDHPEFSSSIEAKDAFTRYTNDVIATVAFGISVNSMENRDNEFYMKGADATNFGGIFRLFKFMLFRMNPRLTRMAGLSFLSRDTATFFHRVVRETVRARDERRIVRPDMIHLLMQARDKDRRPAATNNRMTIDDITAQAFIFFLAGFDTSSTLMCYVAHELALNPPVQERLREEVDRFMDGGNGMITYEALLKMEYMDMVTSETLRKYPPIVFIDRLCVEKFELPPAEQGYDHLIVHPDNIVWFPVYGLHHDPKYFPDPEKFDPERFNDANKRNIVPYTYMPFGLGPRKCIGNRFALMETKILIAYMLRKFRIKRTEKTRASIEFSKTNFSLTPDHGFWIGLEKRDP
ncbi:Cytochrome P450 [Apis cerana cerana]|uniref:Cytochrome P450 n=1 Tax=Apis cerana cerana TaxID=94128 RepID=A0A2A3EAA2_APICC|nr:Cytochrome P450 [Apis cerana cerana]